MIAAFFLSFFWYAIGVFVGPLKEAYGWSASVISGWFFFMQITTVLVGPLCGRLIDRFGVRRFLFVCLPMQGVAIACVGLVGRSTWLFYASAVAVGCFNLAMPALARAVAGWYTSARGVALSIVAMGIGFSSTVGPRLIQAVVDHYNWRVGFMFMGALVFVPLPLLYGWLHERRASKSGRPMLPEQGLPAREVIRKLAFWLIAAAAILWGLAIGCSVHLIAFLTASGLTRAAAANTMIYFGIGSMLGKLVSGALFDRIHLGYVCATMFLLSALALASLGLFHDRFATAAIFTVGATLGSWITAYYFCSARFFGMRAYGEVTAWVSMAYNIGWAIGPVLFAALLESYGSYRAPFIATSVFCAGAGLAMLLLIRCPPAPTPEALLDHGEQIA
jgi:sugar phosphate permease